MFYIVDNRTGQYQRCGYFYDDEGIYDSYSYLVDEDFEYATEYETYEEALEDIIACECNPEDFTILEKVK